MDPIFSKVKFQWCSPTNYVGFSTKKIGKNRKTFVVLLSNLTTFAEFLENFPDFQYYKIDKRKNPCFQWLAFEIVTSVMF
jgi:hypothetical protein